ncbi:hypothetical protein U1Q18_028918 [Sarracenia purpurea var. burkii]
MFLRRFILRSSSPTTILRRMNNSTAVSTVRYTGFFSRFFLLSDLVLAAVARTTSLISFPAKNSSITEILSNADGCTDRRLGLCASNLQSGRLH